MLFCSKSDIEINFAAPLKITWKALKLHGFSPCIHARVDIHLILCKFKTAAISERTKNPKKRRSFKNEFLLIELQNLNFYMLPYPFSWSSSGLGVKLRLRVKGLTLILSINLRNEKSLDPFLWERKMPKKAISSESFFLPVLVCLSHRVVIRTADPVNQISGISWEIGENKIQIFVKLFMILWLKAFFPLC